MAGRQIKDLIRAFQSRDEVTFRRAVAEIIEEEEARNHLALARDMRSLLAAGGRANQPYFELPSSPKARDGEWDLLEVREPDLQFDDLVLNTDVQARLEELAAEAEHWEALDAARIRRRQKVLLTGPAGTGKTSAVEAVASGLGWPLAVVSVDTVVSSYLGETATNLRRVFEFAETNRMILVFDEFDALGRMRDDSSEHGEMKRVVSSFLQFLERYHGPSMVFAVTNYPDLLDFALWRRFDEVLRFDLPSVQAIRRLLRIRSRSMNHRPFQIEAVASQLKGLPHAAVEKLVYDLARHQILRGADSVTPEVVSSVIRGLKQRPW